MRSALFWAIVQRAVIIYYGRFGTTYRPHLQGSRIVCHDVVIGIFGALHQTNTEDRNADIERETTQRSLDTHTILLVVSSDFCPILCVDTCVRSHHSWARCSFYDSLLN
jgi:hypothetical protein